MSKKSVDTNIQLALGRKNSIINNTTNNIFVSTNEGPELSEEKVVKILKDVDSWYCHCGPHGFFFRNKNFLELSLVAQSNSDEFFDFWVWKGVGPAKSQRYEVMLYINDKAFPEYTVIAVDCAYSGGFIAAPCRWDNCSDCPSSNEELVSFFYVDGSMPFLFNKIFLATYLESEHLQLSRRFNFPVFESSEDAALAFSNDLKGERKYSYYRIQKRNP